MLFVVRPGKQEQQSGGELYLLPHWFRVQMGSVSGKDSLKFEGLTKILFFSESVMTSLIALQTLIYERRGQDGEARDYTFTLFLT